MAIQVTDMHMLRDQKEIGDMAKEITQKVSRTLVSPPPEPIISLIGIRTAVSTFSISARAVGKSCSKIAAACDSNWISKPCFRNSSSMQIGLPDLA